MHIPISIHFDGLIYQLQPHGGITRVFDNLLRELSLLYRQIAADLAALREDRGSIHFARYLNQLLARAHNTIYSARRTSPSALVDYFRAAEPADAGIISCAGHVARLCGGVRHRAKRHRE